MLFKDRKPSQYFHHNAVAGAAQSKKGGSRLNRPITIQVVRHWTFHVATLALSIIFSVGPEVLAAPVNFSDLQSEICDNLAAGYICVEGVTKSDDWKYNGDLPKETLDKPWIYDPIGADASGRRNYKITDTSHQIGFTGEFEAVFGTGWYQSLLEANDEPATPLIDAHTGEIIPANWRSGTGYGLPASASPLEFSRQFTVTSSTLSPGQSGCPNGADSCTYEKSYVAVAVDLGGQISAVGDIAQAAVGTQQSVTEEVAILRNTNVLIDGNLKDSIASGVKNQVSTLKVLEDGGLQPTDISLSGTVKVNGTPEGVTWTGEAGEQADFTYESHVDTARYICEVS